MQLCLIFVDELYSRYINATIGIVLRFDWIGPIGCVKVWLDWSDWMCQGLIGLVRLDNNEARFDRCYYVYYLIINTLFVYNMIVG